MMSPRLFGTIILLNRLVHPRIGKIAMQTRF